MKKSIQELVNEAQSVREQVDDLSIKRSKGEFTESDALAMSQHLDRLNELTVQIDSMRACENVPQVEEVREERAELGEEIRTSLREGKIVTHTFSQRDAVLTPAVAPVNHELFKGLIPPLVEKSLLSQLGVTWETSIEGGKPVWASVNKASAEILNEGAEAKDKTLKFTKFEAKMRRMAITFTMSNQAINQADVDLVGIVTKNMYFAIDEKLSEWLVAQNTFEGIEDYPLKEVKKVQHQGDLDFTALLKLEEAVYSHDIDCTQEGVYLMNPKDYYKLKPIAFNNNILSASIAGFGTGIRKVLNNGAPVVITNKVAENTIHYGIWSRMYAMQYDSLRFIADPYTNSKKDLMTFTLNGDFDIRTIEPEYFATMSVTPKK